MTVIFAGVESGASRLFCPSANPAITSAAIASEKNIDGFLGFTLRLLQTDWETGSRFR
jgi:hypothetical protein